MVNIQKWSNTLHSILLHPQRNSSNRTETSMFHPASLRHGAMENGYSLDILQGKLKPKHWYFVDFHEKLALGHPDVILTMGSNEKQYFYELEK